MKEVKLKLFRIIRPWSEIGWKLGWFNKKDWEGDDEVTSSLVGHLCKPIERLVAKQEKYWKEEARTAYNNRDYWRDLFENREKAIEKFKKQVDRIDVSGGGSGRRLKIQLLDLINKL